jgi:hypothetical protein
MLLSASGLAYR